MMKPLFFLLLAVFAPAFIRAQTLISYPAPTGSLLNDDFTVEVRRPGREWQALSVYQVKVDKVENARHTPQLASMAYFDFSGAVEVSVRYNKGTIRTTRVQPLSAGVTPQVKSNTIRFSLSRPCNLSVEVNGDLFHNLHLFAGPVETFHPNPADTNTIYYGPGIHQAGTVAVPSGKTVYIAGGAIVRGQFLVSHAENVRIIGRGILSQYGWKKEARGRGDALTVAFSKNVVIDGITVLPEGYTVLTGNAQNVSIRNMRSFSAGGNNDGIDIFCSREVTVDSVFMRNSDDNIAIYGHRWGYYGNTKDITVRNSVLWADVAHPILIGTHGDPASPDTLEDMKFVNIDVLDQAEAQLNYQGCMSINAGDDNLVRHIRFEDIRVGDIREGQLVNLRVMYNRKYNTAPGRGISDIYFKNISYDGGRANLSVISGYDSGRSIKNVTFEGLRINGRLIWDSMPGKPAWYQTGDFARFYVGEHVEGLRFIAESTKPFIHPGLLHSREDLERMKKAVAAKEEPIYAGYLQFIQNPSSQNTYKMQGPLDTVGRNPTIGQNVYDNDANAAHQNAVMWYITGEKAYAEKAIEILNAWSSALKAITGRDAVLMAGLGPFKMVLAAEIIRYTNAGWKEEDILRTERHFKEVIYPVLKDFALFANGNWDAAAIKTVMAIAVFCNDRPMFERALRYYTHGGGNGAIRHYVINDMGQVQESGRDQGHTQLGIGMLAESCEIAWRQGLDLYGYDDHRLLKGFEYVAKYNLGIKVPFSETLDKTGKYHHTEISARDSGRLRPIFEQVYNHYKQLGIATPYTQQAAEKLRPEGPGKPGADHPGYGTLFYSGAAVHQKDSLPSSPGAIYAAGTPKAIALSWIPPVGAKTFTIKRSGTQDGPYIVIARNITGPSFTDADVTPAKTYYYTVSASNAAGESDNAYPAGITAGLPEGWQQQDIGHMAVTGATSFDGETFLVVGGGNGIGSLADSFHYTYKTLPGNGDGEITARFVPQPSSQFSSMGLMFRSGVATDAPFAALLIYPQKTEQVEAPVWQVRLLQRATAAGALQPAIPLQQPAVSWSRLTGYIWLRLQKKGNACNAFISYNGTEWSPAGSVKINLGKQILVGIRVASGMTNTTSVLVDHVLLSP